MIKQDDLKICSLIASLNILLWLGYLQAKRQSTRFVKVITEHFWRTSFNKQRYFIHQNHLQYLAVKAYKVDINFIHME